MPYRKLRESLGQGYFVGMNDEQLRASLEYLENFLNAITFRPTITYSISTGSKGISFMRVMGSGQHPRVAIFEYKMDENDRIVDISGYQKPTGTSPQKWIDIPSMAAMEDFLTRRLAPNAAICALLAGANNRLKSAADASGKGDVVVALDIYASPHARTINHDGTIKEIEDGSGYVTIRGPRDNEVVLKLDQHDLLDVRNNGFRIEDITHIASEEPFTAEAQARGDAQGNAHPQAMVAVGKIMACLGMFDEIKPIHSFPPEVLAALGMMRRQTSEQTMDPIPMGLHHQRPAAVMATAMNRGGRAVDDPRRRDRRGRHI